ncbi:flagellar biosynthesis protein FlhA [Roseibium aggregatum]|uniref:Flagellar biosynthesis protein FlhA n=1 Tax=Roseibium aggregatum TaxID=187304 RepID=A0A939EEK7_9HYPH|nr:flagellar biosynthesis protein FlhA [Roseibium aggregatum]MBN9670718.1 flagellar biosynthesis protein FlhA [Roseibium aggregatum]
MTDTSISSIPGDTPESRRDVLFALGIVVILAVLFLPIPTFLIDLGLAMSIALSVLILMVALWIQRPLDFSSFPTILLIATMLRLSLNIATTRVILAHGYEGTDAAGFVINGFSQFVMSGDFVIGLIVFAILIIVNFMVITKGATRIAEVGARFTLDAIPGKQMAIDADLSAGLIDDKEAQRRRKELEEESSFFGAMDGASKFVRGDAVAGLIITAVNVFGGIVIGVTRYDMSVSDAADVFTKLSVGDGLVSQIPALVVSLAAGLLVSKGGTRGSADKAVLGQLGGYPRALFVAAILMGVFAIMPGLPMLPFLLLSGLMGFIGYAIPKRVAAQKKVEDDRKKAAADKERAREKDSVKETLKSAEIELVIGKQLSAGLLAKHGELSRRVAKMRRKFAEQFGFVVPDIRVTDSLTLDPKSYQIKIHGTIITAQQLKVGELLVIPPADETLPVPADPTKEPAFGMPAYWVPPAYAEELKRSGLAPAENITVILTHLSEVIRNNLPQLLSYKDMRQLFNRLEPEYQKLLEDICPAHTSFSGLQAVLKLLLAERVSIRNLNLILEAVAEIVPHVRRSEQVAEHVRMRIAQQICGDLAEGGPLKVLRLGNRWDLAFHNALKRDAKGDVIEFDIEPQLVEDFGSQMSDAVKKHMKEGSRFAVVAAPDARPYVRMIVERMFPNLPVLSHLEIARGVDVAALGSVS